MLLHEIEDCPEAVTIDLWLFALKMVVDVHQALLVTIQKKHSANKESGTQAYWFPPSIKPQETKVAAYFPASYIPWPQPMPCANGTHCT